MKMQLLSVDEGDLNMEHWALVLSSANNTATSRYQLPDGWVVEEVTRRDGSSVDKVLLTLPQENSQPLFENAL